MRDSFQRTPLVLLQHPSAFDALGGLLPSVFKLPELSRESPRQNSPVPSSRKAPRRIPVGGSCSGSFSPPSSRSWSPLLSESRAGAAVAAPWLRLPSAPVVTCSRCSHNSGRGRRKTPRGRVNPWFLPLTLPLPRLAAPFLYIPLRLAASAANQPHGGATF